MYITSHICTYKLLIFLLTIKFLFLKIGIFSGLGSTGAGLSSLLTGRAISSSTGSCFIGTGATTAGWKYIHVHDAQR